MNKIALLVFFMILWDVFNSVNANPLPSDQKTACIHEVGTGSNKLKVYKYAMINPDMTCPPFLSDYEIPENRIVKLTHVIWDIPSDLAAEHRNCYTALPDQCARFDKSGLTHDQKMECETAIYLCNVVDTDHSCRGGLLPMQ